MKSFDCLALDCPLFGQHLLEASAGTGKTFSMEHVYVRSILESIEVEQILAITFTRAAARELKARIRANLEKALEQIQNKETSWPYLQPHLGSIDAIRSLRDALAGFDRCQIYTIHGFCYRILSEFAFELHIGSIADPDAEQTVPAKLKTAAIDFLEYGIDSDLLCPEQMSLLYNAKNTRLNSVEAIAQALLNRPLKGQADSFAVLHARCKAALHAVEADLLLEDFAALRVNYKALKGDFEAQVRALASIDDPQSMRVLLQQKGSLFRFLDPANQKVRLKEITSLHYPGFFERAKVIQPLLQQKVFPVLQAAWQPIAEKILAQEEYFNPDAILSQMLKALQNDSFAEQVRDKYLVAIVDEFQDTDAVQWEIFQRLFLEKPMKALYFVGDPKQSIYRFRKADVYTYLQARDWMGEDRVYRLDTNYRSSKPLVSALNALFDRDWLQLPKLNRSLPYFPVQAGVEVEGLDDGKGAIHFYLGEGGFDQIFLPYAIAEIERLNLRRCALLVKDRYQAEKALTLCKARGLAAVARSHVPLGETVAFLAVRELFDAIDSPRDASKTQVVMHGPLGSGHLLSFTEYKRLLDTGGLVALARAMRAVFETSPHCADILHIFEHLFAWEKREGFSFLGLVRYLDTLQTLTVEEGGRRRMEVDDDAIQIMTLHNSKGLEFEVVFALGVASRTPEVEEDSSEFDAEKLRQLYVALTRAKKRLYVPIDLTLTEPLQEEDFSEDEERIHTIAKKGTHSPMTLFCQQLGEPVETFLTRLAQTEAITVERIVDPILLDTPRPDIPVATAGPSLIPAAATPCYLSSFTTLANVQVEEDVSYKPSVDVQALTLQAMPRGVETGLIIHQIFQALFQSKEAIWRDPVAMDVLVAEKLQGTALSQWIAAIQEMVRHTMTLPLQADGEFFSLSELTCGQVQVEVEFLFSSSPHFIKGFIDLIFCIRGKVYFVDWKTNWMEEYTPERLREVMTLHDYWLQADLYAEAIRRHFTLPLGGAFYLFVRGGQVLFKDFSA